LLDEPTSALDPASRVDMMRLAVGLDGGYVMATHAMDEAELADVVVVMVGGTVAAAGPPDYVFGGGWDPAWGLERPFSMDLRCAYEASRRRA